MSTADVILLEQMIPPRTTDEPKSQLETKTSAQPLQEETRKETPKSDQALKEESLPDGTKNPLGEHIVNSDNLSPPPSENPSPHATPVVNTLRDEIVVGANTVNGTKKSSPPHTVLDQEDVPMADAEDDQPSNSNYPKRKRSSIYQDLSEVALESDGVDSAAALQTKVLKKPAAAGIKGVVLGYYRGSTVPDPKGKHAIVGFIDTRDRLRTRVQPATRSGDQIDMAAYPLPPGPGGSWVTFERIVFEEHLVGLDHYQIKEYVKIRTDAQEPTEEARRSAEIAAVREAKARVDAHPPPDNAPAPSVAYGIDLPVAPPADSRIESSNKRRRVSGGFAPINSTPPAHSPPDPQDSPFVDPLPGTRPTRILIGYWKGSSEVDPRDRHAVYGILGQNDMFRVKVVRETRDGRYVDGNFPAGAGALWIHYDEVEMEDHIKSLSRHEIKEYCRVRQRYIDEQETPEDRVANETKAVYEAKNRVARGFKGGAAVTSTQTKAQSPVPAYEEKAQTDFGGHELRQSRRLDPRVENRGVRHALPDSSRGHQTDLVERTSSIARREIAKVEAAQSRVDRHAATRAIAAQAAASLAESQMPITPAPRQAGKSLHKTDEVQRLNDVWARQEAHRLKAGVEDAKIYGGIKYERKTNGPFQGRFVSQGTIISINGEDYVEYRVLTKPTFF